LVRPWWHRCASVCQPIFSILNTFNHEAFLRHLAVIASISTALTFAAGILPVVAGETTGSSQASQGVRRISQDIATGHSGSEIPLIELSPGYGVNISFIPVGR
jgi:hypothetical protein